MTFPFQSSLMMAIPWIWTLLGSKVCCMSTARKIVWWPEYVLSLSYVWSNFSQAGNFDWCEPVIHDSLCPDLALFNWIFSIFCCSCSQCWPYGVSKSDSSWPISQLNEGWKFLRDRLALIRIARLAFGRSSAHNRACRCYDFPYHRLVGLEPLHTSSRVRGPSNRLSDEMLLQEFGWELRWHPFADWYFTRSTIKP